MVAAVHVVIVGCGRVGSSLSRRLLDDGHSVALIDTDPSAFEKRFPEGFAGTKVIGFGFDRDTLTQAGIDRAQALAAVTSGDNSNIIVARIARETYQVENVVARIYDPGRALVYRRLGIPTIATVEWTTDQAMRRLFPSETRTEWVDPTGGVALVERTLPNAWAGSALDALDLDGRWRLMAITRGGKATLAAGKVIGQEGDVLLLAVDGAGGDELDAVLAAGPKGH
jgi:trk system potassium uptake protein TrkA